MVEFSVRTVWGQEWICAADLIFANSFTQEEIADVKKEIINISLVDNEVFALVQAENSSPYKVVFEIEQYGEFEVSFIQDYLQKIYEEFPDIDYVNGQRKISIALNERKIPIIPQREELKFRCTCKEHANEICIHIVSIFYQLANTIERQPLFPLEWRGFSSTPENFKRNSKFKKRKLKRIKNKFFPSRAEKKGITPVIHISILQNYNFSLKLFIEDKSDPLSTPIPYSELYDPKLSKIFGKPSQFVKIELLKTLIQVGMKLPELVRLLHRKGKEEVTVTLERVGEILLEERESLDSLGVDFILPYELHEILFPKIGYFSDTPKTIQYLEASDLTKFDLKIALGDMMISHSEFEELSKSAGKLVPFRDRFVFITSNDVAKIVNSLSAPKEGLSKANILYSALTGKYKGQELKLDKNLSEFIARLYEPEDTSLPYGLNAVMRPYQLKGFAWMYSTLKKGLGVCIADDMGLGKTLQVIAVLLKLKQENRLNKQVLVICPTTILGNWQREIQRFAPDLKAKIYHGEDKAFDNSVDIVITTYTHARLYSDFFSNREWTMLVIDEAQNIKNPTTEQTKAIKSIPTEFRIAMSGTPIENRLTELWSIFDFLNPDFLGTLKWFKTEYALPIESYKIKSKIEQFKKLTSPFMIRRLKSDKSIITDLPDKIVREEYCYLSKEQIVIYQSVVKEGMEILLKLDGIARRGKVFQMITALKQICNHPAHFTKKKSLHPNLSGKSQRLLSLLASILPTGEKTILFTQYTEMGEILLDILEKHVCIKADFFHGSLGRSAREEMIADFQNDESKKLLLISLKAGGTGLNLVQATNVIHYDLWWNPAVEDQATDRAYRIGQTKNVRVHRLITIGTFEEKIDQIIKGKRELADLTISNGEKWITELSNDELMDLFSLSGII